MRTVPFTVVLILLINAVPIVIVAAAEVTAALPLMPVVTATESVLLISFEQPTLTIIVTPSMDACILFKPRAIPPGITVWVELEYPWASDVLTPTSIVNKPLIPTLPTVTSAPINPPASNAKPEIEPYLKAAYIALAPRHRHSHAAYRDVFQINRHTFLSRNGIQITIRDSAHCE
jgi:hypothetical protein